MSPSQKQQKRKPPGGIQKAAWNQELWEDSRDDPAYTPLDQYLYKKIGLMFFLVKMSSVLIGQIKDPRPNFRSM